MTQIVSRHRWLPYVLPFFVYMSVGLFEPKPQRIAAAPDKQTYTTADDGRAADRGSLSYPIYYTVRIALTVAAILPFLPVYWGLARRPTMLAVFIGAGGAVVWIGLCTLRLEAAVLQPMGLAKTLLGSARPSFDPFATLGDSQLGLVVFLVIRFCGLVFVVSLIEELFLRGFLMRYFLAPQWWTLPIGQATPLAVTVAVLYGVLTHPSEALAAAVWFSLITWLVHRTRNFWDAITAHAVTNLLLGIYIVVFRDWSLW